MHEQSLFKDFVAKAEQVVRAHGAVRVARVRVRVGALCNISPDHFREHFELAAAGTVVEGAVLDIARGESVTSGDALAMVLESVDLEVPS
jgi:hydrogenase nickel incorporation protein HypA/HybF